MSYVIITPARNECLYLQKTIDSVVAQTVRPQKWIIVNDGSIDNTGLLIDAATKKHPWIQAVHRPDRGFRKAGGGVIEAFYDGFRLLAEQPWRNVVKLDCDLSFEPDYFEKLLTHFAVDSKLGIASGVYLEAPNGADWREIEMPIYHAAGASKVVRRECWDEIGGFIASRGWDTADEIRAMARGWRTTHFQELRMKHWKIEGTGIGPVRTSAMHGEIYYLTGGGWLFFLFKVLHRLNGRPFLIGALAMVWGYFHVRISGRERLVTREEAKHYRALLYGRITARLSRLPKVG